MTKKLIIICKILLFIYYNKILQQTHILCTHLPTNIFLDLVFCTLLVFRFLTNDHSVLEPTTQIDYVLTGFFNTCPLLWSVVQFVDKVLLLLLLNIMPVAV